MASRKTRQFTEDELRFYKEHFKMFDLNGDGSISAKELRTASRRLGYRFTDEQVEGIMSANDLDCDGSLSFEEFLQAMPANTKTISEEEHRMAEVRRKFAEFDQDGSGSVSAAEAHEILEKELAFTPAQSAELVARYDKNGDGQLTFEEFVSFYSKVKARAEKIQKMFREFDKDNSGSISTDEAKLMLGRFGLSDADIEALIDKYDTNKDGELQYGEFVAFLMHA